MDIEKIIQQFKEFTEEPDAFETESERQMEKELEAEIDKDFEKNKVEFFKKRNFYLNSLRKYFLKVPYTRDVQIVTDMNDRRYRYLKFYISRKGFDWLSKWKYFNPFFIKSGLNISTDGIENNEGYIVTIE